jgi:molybdopterin molybdotransferase
MLGRRRTIRPTVTAVLAEDTPKAEGLHVFARGVASWDETGRLTVRDTGPQASNLYSSVLSANCIVHLPEAWTEAKAGASVQIEWLDWSGIPYSPTS